MKSKQKIHSYIQKERENYITFFKKMIKEPSVAGAEEGVQSLVAERLKESGLEVEMWELDYKELSQSPFFNSERTDFNGSPNVVGVWKGSGGGRSVILNGHVDVVPEGEIAQWNDDPFSAKEENGRIYGRGTTDMKGGNLSALIALESLLHNGYKLKGDVIFESVVEEESGGSGTLAAIQKGYKADVALIPEPSELRIFPKQQGSMWFEVSIKGISAHGGTRYEGVSAVEKGIIVYQHIAELEKKRNDRITDPLYEDNPIPIPINMGKFQGGYFPSSVPDRATIEGRMGIEPGETIEEAKKEFEEWLDGLSSKDDWFKDNPVDVKWFGLRLPPGNCDLDHPMMDILQKSYKETKGKEAVVAGSTWGTDGGLLTQVGNIPSIIFGPGTTKVCHYPNEYIEIEHIFEVAEIMALAILQWCGHTEQ